MLLLYGFNPSSVFQTVNAKKVIQQICCNVKEVSYLYSKDKYTTDFFADSNASAEEFMKQYPDLKCGTLHNLFKIEEPKRCLRIMTASRLSWEKGYEKNESNGKTNEPKRNTIYLDCIY